MYKRKPISKKLRFEVFKRDGFTCQYCGKSAPEVILEVDHIEAVANGGTNDIMNLITSCRDCNRGKSKIKLTDNQTISKEKKQLELLQERKNQLEMMYQWKKELIDLDNEEVNRLIELVNMEHGFGISLTDTGNRNLSKLIKKYSFDEVLEGLTESFKQYGYNHEVAFKKIESVIKNIRKQKEKPYLKDVYYIRSILKNRFRLTKRQLYDSLDLIETSILCDGGTDYIKTIAKICDSYKQFESEMNSIINKHIEEHVCGKQKGE